MSPGALHQGGMDVNWQTLPPSSPCFLSTILETDLCIFFYYRALVSPETPESCAWWWPPLNLTLSYQSWWPRSNFKVTLALERWNWNLHFLTSSFPAEFKFGVIVTLMDTTMNTIFSNFSIYSREIIDAFLHLCKNLHAGFSQMLCKRDLWNSAWWALHVRSNFGDLGPRSKVTWKL